MSLSKLKIHIMQDDKHFHPLPQWSNLDNQEQISFYLVHLISYNHSKKSCPTVGIIPPNPLPKAPASYLPGAV